MSRNLSLPSTRFHKLQINYLKIALFVNFKRQTNSFCEHDMIFYNLFFEKYVLFLLSKNAALVFLRNKIEGTPILKLAMVKRL